MRTLEDKLVKHIDLLMERYPKLEAVRQEIIDAYLLMEESYRNGGKLLIAGNGGSAADSEHIAGELMKRFKILRPVSKEYAEKLKEVDPERGAELARNLEQRHNSSLELRLYDQYQYRNELLAGRTHQSVGMPRTSFPNDPGTVCLRCRNSPEYV